jgi:putative transcriptional regulator
VSHSTHPSSQLIAAFAARDLPVAAGVTVAAHLEACPTCRLRVRLVEEAAGEGLGEQTAAPLAAGALEDVLQRLDLAAPDPPLSRSEPATTIADVRIPSAAGRVGLGSRRWLAPGLWTARVRAPATDRWRAFLLRAPAGTRIPMHQHGGAELITVISGAFDQGRRYAAGDFAENDGQERHELTVTSDGPCACLVSTQGRLIWSGWSKMVGTVLDI